MADRKRPYRLRAIHRAMSFETFERTVPVRPGWKREYYGGKAHVRPSWTTVTYVLPLGPRPVAPTDGLRPLTPADGPVLQAAFLDSFRYAPEYADYPAAAFRRRAGEFVRGFFGEVRGRWSPASAVVARRGRILAAAMVKERDGKPPLLDCLFARPAHFRRGLATVSAAAAVNRLAEAGHEELVSRAMLANEPSLAWHERFGFREVSDFFVAQARCFCAKFELERRQKLGILTDDERERLRTTAERWWREVKRLDRLPVERRHPALDL